MHNNFNLFLKMYKALISSLLVASTSAAGSGYDYKTDNGKDWPTLTGLKDATGKAVENQCGKTNQSPIDLKTSWDVVEDGVKEDGFNRLYTNQKTDITVQWTGDTSKIAVNKAGQALQTFESNYASDFFGAPNRYTGV